MDVGSPLNPPVIYRAEWGDGEGANAGRRVVETKMTPRNQGGRFRGERVEPPVAGFRGLDKDRTVKQRAVVLGSLP